MLFLQFAIITLRGIIWILIGLKLMATTTTATATTTTNDNDNDNGNIRKK